MTDEETARILLVDDDPEVLELVERQLRRHDDSFEIVSVSDPGLALELFEDDEQLDCVVSDYRMGSMTGLELLEAVRAHDEYLPFVLLTAKGDERVASEAISAGVTRYLQKNAQGGAEELASEVRDAIDLYRERTAVITELTFLENVFEAAEDVVFVIDTQGRVIYFNEALRRLVDFDDAASPSYLDVIPEREHERVEAAFSTALESGKATVQAHLETRDGEVLYEFTGTALRVDDDVVGVCGIGRDISRHKAHEETLEGLLDTSRALLTAETEAEIAEIAAGATATIVDDPLGAVYLKRENRLRPVGITEGASKRLDEPPTYAPDEDCPVPNVLRTGEAEWVRDVREIDDERNRDPLREEVVHPLDGYGVLVLGLAETTGLSRTDRHLVEILVANTTAALGRLETETGLRERETALRTLHTKTRELMQTTSHEDVASVVVDAARNMLDLPEVDVFLWNEESGRLRAASSDDASAELPSELDSENRLAWDAFTEQETKLGTELEANDDDTDALQSELAVPLGPYGVLISGSNGLDSVDEPAVELVELLASNATAAFERTERERQLRKQESRLQAQNDQLQRLNRINTIIRDINSALVAARSKADIQRTVCEKLAEAEYYEFTWIGHRQLGTDSIVVDAWDGSGRGLLDHLLNEERTEWTVFDEVLRSGETAVVANIVRDERFDPWRKPAVTRGFQSVVCLPLTWKEHDYGFLEIYADRPNVFDKDEIAVLEELAVDIANAINAVERKKALVSGQSTDIVLEFDDIDDPLFELARRTGVSLTVDGLLPRSDDSWLVYLRTPVGASGTVVDACSQFVSISDATVVRSESDTELLTLTVSDFSLVETFGTHGASIQSIDLEAGRGVVTVTVPPSADVRAFVESCDRALGDLSLVGREPSDPSTSTHELRYDLKDIVTEKQFEALKAGYFDGYFEIPREHTGEEMAEKLDVSGPTYQHHIRKGLRRILGTVFDPTEN